MTLHPIPGPDSPDWGNGQEPLGGDEEALLMAWGEALKQEGAASLLLDQVRSLRIEVRDQARELSTVRQAVHVLSATDRVESVAQLAGDLLTELLQTQKAAIWVRGENGFDLKVTKGMNRPGFPIPLPAPNPFPDTPCHLGQWQVMERTDLPSPLPVVLESLGSRTLFLPMEDQGLLFGFLLLDFDSAPDPESSRADTLELLLRLFGSALFRTWSEKDLRSRREDLQTREETHSHQMAALVQENLAIRKGQGHRMEFLGVALGQLRPLISQILSHLSRSEPAGSKPTPDEGNVRMETLLQGKRVAEILRDLTEMTQGDTQPQEGPPIPLDLGILLAELSPIVAGFPECQGGEQDWPELSDLPEVLACRETLSRVLLSLCQGAAKLSAAGDVHLWIEREPLHLAIRLLLPGLDLPNPPSDLHRTGSLPPSELYVQRRTGPGLGLVIAEHLVRGMGGQLRLDRDFFGQGAVVSLQFPVA